MSAQPSNQCITGRDKSKPRARFQSRSRPARYCTRQCRLRSWRPTPTNSRKSSQFPSRMAFPATSTGSRPKPRRSRALATSALVLLAAFGGGGVAMADAPLLPAEQAFRFSARAIDDRTIEARFEVADGYYLYRDKTAFFLDTK